MKKSELKQMIEQVEDLHVTSINVPEWNFDVYVRMLSGDDIDAIGTAYQVTKDKSGVVAANNAFTDELLVRSLCDEDGNQLFDITELPSLKKKNGEALKRIVKESLRLNRLDKEGQDSAVKTSGADQTG